MTTLVTTSEWRLKRLDDITTKIGSGATPRGGKNAYKVNGIALIRSQNVYNFNFLPANLAFIDDEQAAELANVIVQEDDILLNITGASVARCCLVDRKFLPARVNQHVAIIRVRPELADPRFVLYCINSPHFKTRLLALAQGGATREALTKTTIEDFEVWQPPLPVQKRIAGILSAYDELIENSQRRIRTLEAMARALYREWFVYFRFPGAETFARVASPIGGIPEGWVVKPVSDSFEIVGGGTPSRDEPGFWTGGNIQWFSPSNLTGAATMFMDDSPEHITALGLQKSSARLFPPFSVMMTSRATIGAIAINTHEATTNQGFITCLPNDRVPLHFLFHWLTENVPQFVRLASGATFKEISRGVFKTIEFLHPTPELLRRFEAQAGPMSEQVLCLQRQVQNLLRTRDLLLPRLLSGQIEMQPD
jgi:type I restriction enzyme S subunit